MLSLEQARTLRRRIDAGIPLFLHAYAYHLNMRCGTIRPLDLLDIAVRHRLQGVKIHMLDGEEHALGKAAPEQLQYFGNHARHLGLELHIETSSSEPAELDAAVRVALGCGATSLRFYPRYQGRLSEVLRRTAADIQYLRQRHGKSGLRFTIEQHEDLKSHELVRLVQQSGFDRLSILFDFANMVNANEDPLAALASMAPHISEVHLKDALIERVGTGSGHRACKSGHGHLPFKALLARLICLGEDQVQVLAYGLEEEVDYYAPPFRFDDEGPNPWIPWREMSETPLPDSGLTDRLAQEIRDAEEQLAFVRRTLAELREEAGLLL